MADRRFRNTEIWVSGKKCALVEGTDFTHNTGDEAVVTNEGYSGHTDGQATTEVTIKVVESDLDENKTLKDAIANKSYVDVLQKSGGSWERVRGRFVSRSGSSTSSSGKTTADFKFQGGAPQRVS